MGVISIELVGNGCDHLCKNEEGPKLGPSFEKHQIFKKSGRGRRAIHGADAGRGEETRKAWQHLEALGESRLVTGGDGSRCDYSCVKTRV